MLKAASYVLFEASPSSQACLRALTAELGADVLLQDDSGIPLAWLLPSSSSSSGDEGPANSTDGSTAAAAAGDEGGQVIPGWHVKPFGGYAAGPTTGPYEQPLLQRVFDEGPRDSPWPLGPLRYGYCLPYSTQAELKTLERQGAVADAAARDAAAAEQQQKRLNNQTSVDQGGPMSLDGGIEGRNDGVREPSGGAGGGSSALRQREVCNVIVATRLHGGLTRSDVEGRAAAGKRAHRLRGAAGSSGASP